MTIQSKANGIKVNYFDLLPSHPPPEPLESLTGYIARLAISNGVTTLPDLINLLGLEEHRGIVYGYNDCPPSTLGKLCDLTLCTEPILLATTFYYLARKFNWSIRASEVSKFLTGTTASYFRYCPLCLEEYLYYSLTWRFKALKGCAQHNCKLLEKCGHCKSRIPLFTNPIILGKCSECKKPLRTSPILSLPAKEKELVKKRQQDLQFLLMPSLYEENAPSVIIQLGRQLRDLRLNNQQSIGQVAKIVKTQPSQIFFAEEGRSKNGRALFQTYQVYTDYFGITLAQLFANVVSNPK